MKLDFGTILACIIVIGLISGAGIVLDTVLFGAYDSDIETCMTVGIVISWSFFIIQYKTGNTLPKIPE